MKPTRIYLCENSIDGIFSAIYQAWNSKYGHSYIKIEEQWENNQGSNMELFSEYLTVNTDYELALKVSKAIHEKISEEAYKMLCRTALSNYVGKADLIYRFMILGFHMGNKVLDHLSDISVMQVVKLNKNVVFEVQHLFGFLRFSEQEAGTLSAVIHPKNDIITILGEHFSDRLPQEKFIIYDGSREKAVLHMPGKPWILVETGLLEKTYFNTFSSEEDEYRKLWKAFYDHIGIKERTNLKLQRNMLPLRFRSDMTEFQMMNQEPEE